MFPVSASQRLATSNWGRCFFPVTASHRFAISASQERLCSCWMFPVPALHRTLSLLMAVKLGWGSCRMFPGLISVVEFLNMFAKMSASPTERGSPIGPHKICLGGTQIRALTTGLAWRMSMAFIFQYVGWASMSGHLTKWGFREESPRGTSLHSPFMQYHWLQGQKNTVCRPRWHHPVPGTTINKAWVWAVGHNKTNLLDTWALALIGGHHF